MRNLYLFFLLSILCLSACRSDFDAFQDHALKLAEDGEIKPAEFDQLLNDIRKAKGSSFNRLFYDNGRLDTSKVANYLSKLYANKNIKIAPDGIWSSRASERFGRSSRFNVNVYLENSASIDGYVNGSTTFKDAIYSLLGDISINNYCDSLNLNYINKTVTFTRQMAGAAAIHDFIQTLTPDSFRRRGGNRGSSDLKEVMSTVLGRTNENNASILVSDFVFSPGRRVNAHDYLAGQSIGIKVDFANKLKHFDLSVLAIQLISDFAGYYYDQMDKPTMMHCRRPYYIWIMGSRTQLRTIIKSGTIERIRAGYLHKLLIQGTRIPFAPNYKILYADKIGAFRLPNSALGPITDARASTQPRTRNKFGFHVAVDFSESLQDAAFFLDTTNYRHNDNYSLRAEQISSNTADPSLKGFTHQLHLMTTALRPEKLTISVKAGVPVWVKYTTSENDQRINSDLQEQQKTFGLQYVVDGMYDAFDQVYGNNAISSFDIIIK
ncbi:MAG: hypothetical protein JWR38_5305 [Mucilaginibacter sp.]|nr:hypothetical protein [Mucilaginibacter sp.]